MAPKRSKKRAAVDDEDITPLLPESTQMEAARPAKKKEIRSAAKSAGRNRRTP
jgi:hypothetical protein